MSVMATTRSDDQRGDADLQIPMAPEQRIL